METVGTQPETAKTAPARNPSWFKDAVIYQIHVRAFFDASGDGVGDFRGLTEKLDYIEGLGITAIWLQPFFMSPLRDDGYDIADYTRINPAYGTLRDFETFLQEAHRRDLRVITEMVMNHTSDQHEWFQKSRRAKPGDKWRDYYVWSDTDERYEQARIIFEDFETSNWTWDEVAQAYYWHRFYHHQPDLNFDNPDVHQAMFDAVDFWFDKGVDGMRLDAVPYLYEREGTNCENLPETHAFLRELRRHVDEKYDDKMLLAEANQWPEDAAAYYGDGDECHMNFHFPLMPRLFMSIEREDRFPIIDILEQTPEIPENCQWGIFLRNHDELTLEMVTDEERDYMYRAYAADPRARVNLGIRRRLAPLLRDDRRKTELMNALLLSLPGTPIIYYGDEIRMGDNIYLGDRDAVRTPMQWNDDRNAGFSRANPQQLYLPVIIDPPFHYASRNVEVEQSRPHSTLWWTRRIIAQRKQLTAMGRGVIEFLSPDNPKVLAFLRQHEDETILVVANLSRYVQCVELDLSRFRGQHPVELFGQAQFPPIGELPYFLTLGAYAFYWFRLEWGGDEAEPLDAALPSCTISARWDALFENKALSTLEAALPAFMKRHRWFGGKARAIQQVKLLDVLTVHDFPEVTADPRRDDWPSGGLPATRVLVARAEYVEGEPEIYVLPVVFAQGEQQANLLADRPGAGIVSIARSDDVPPATLCDASREDEFWLLLFDAIRQGRTIPGRHGAVESLQTHAFSQLQDSGSFRPPQAAKVVGVAADDAQHAPALLDVVIHGGEQSNTSAVIGGRQILKMFRRIDKGENPDFEIGRYLTETTQLGCVPQVAGALTYRAASGEEYTLAVLHEYVANEGDAWVYTLDELDRYLDRVEAELSGPPPGDALAAGTPLTELAGHMPPNSVQEVVGPYLQSAELLGRRTAEMHLALASGDSEAFAPEPFTKLYQRSIYQSMRAEARKTLSFLMKRAASLPGDARDLAQRLLQNEQALIERYQQVAETPINAQRIRCHGDFHLGQVLFTGKDFVIIDFEGEPERPIGERRIKKSPLRDVAGMLRSFHYASHAALTGPHRDALLPTAGSQSSGAWLTVWYRWTAAMYLKAYLAEASQGGFLPPRSEDFSTLLEAYLLEKAIYELRYEMNNRPDWVQIPLRGILDLLEVGSASGD
ncbi:MAG: maltose alpha-D-glucosyltransferase [Planctomycetota bacterium]|nr:MAG: maltose alpha-D-glucosyltransferase [Planctomycetota bacterium]